MFDLGESDYHSLATLAHIAQKLESAIFVRSCTIFAPSSPSLLLFPSNIMHYALGSILFFCHNRLISVSLSAANLASYFLSRRRLERVLEGTIAEEVLMGGVQLDLFVRNSQSSGLSIVSSTTMHTDKRTLWLKGMSGRPMLPVAEDAHATKS